ncbi:ABC transporter substrate-binding protein [Roseovarius atlanticus]|uniref:ABC transporter substrate-binding protein n=1 Tax=Roseovarius atlanticus TaxID=1641875 RepID=UPI001C963E2C|nr:ABC transporter substrate-binding protein [Roseovarius atlanticus]MBY5986624.1 ABC transporter substrate-binding protein [Roseovarius atlanticus]MBY6125264.1 ABC transporter substrate-binding protein [Roseovarius atlanticus]MBY6150275.1 ABC transporter substrate-binding protein [Roseovarius atlanticus]
MKNSLKLIAALVMAGLPATAQDVPGVTDDSISIGVMGPFSGNASSYSKALVGMMAYYDKVNAEGGVHGRKLVAIPEDTACDPSKGLAAAKKLIHQDEVFMLHGNSCSGVAVAIRPVVEEAGLPWLVAHAVSDSISEPLARNIFHGVPTGSANGRAMAQFVLSKPDTERVAIIEHSNDWAHSYSNPAREYLSENGVEPVAELTMERGQTDATAQILKLREAKPDFIIAAIYEAETAIFLRDLKKYGLGDIPVMGTAGTDLENTLKRVGDFDTVKNYFVIHSYVDNLDGPKLQPVRDILAEYAPDEELSTFSFVSIGSAKALVAALEAAGPDLTREKLIDAMEGIENFETGVLSAPITWSETDHQGVKGSAVAGFVDGEPTVLSAWNTPY